MSSQFNNLFSSLEELISHASKTNTEIISETTKFLSGVDKSNLNKDFLTNLQQGILTEAVSKVAALNIKYTKDLMNVGLELSKSLNNKTTGTEEPTSTAPPSSVSAFEIKTSGVAGGIAETAFLLNSDKDAPILCKVQNTSYTLQAEVPMILNFDTIYTPQLFELTKGIAQRVDVQINLPVDTAPGIYYSKITVAGFEHTHFDLYVEVIAPIVKPTTTAKTTTAKPVTPKEVEKSASKKTVAKKTVAKKAVAKKTVAKKAVTKKASTAKKTTKKL